MTQRGQRPVGPPLPSPGVTLTPELIRRVGAFAGRLSAARDREEAGRKRTLQGEGQEFIGHRPYRPGEDLKDLDWDLMARMDRAFVRVHRSDAREAWVVALDTSASMGLGAVGKLQSAAEAAAAIISLGLRLGAAITLVVEDQRVEARRSRDQREVFRVLGGLRVKDGQDAGAGSSPEPPRGGLERLVAGPTAVVPGLLRGRGGAGRLFLLGDLLDLRAESVLRLTGGRRRIHLGQVLSAGEWNPAAALGARDVETGALWVDPETGLRRAAAATGEGLGRYQRRLEAFVEGWENLSRAHGLSHAHWSDVDAFESHVGRLLR